MFKAWFERNLTANQRYAISTADEVVIVKETEKAVCQRYVGKFTIEMWVPRSAFYTAEEFKAEAARNAEKKSAREEKYNALVNFGKENGLKFRVGLKINTMLAKLAAAGLEYNYYN